MASDASTHLKVKRSFCIKSCMKPHRPLHPFLRKLRVDYDGIDVNDIDLTELPVAEKRKGRRSKRVSKYAKSMRVIRPSDIEKIRAELQTLVLDDDDKRVVENICRGIPFGTKEDVPVELDVFLPSGMGATISATGATTLSQIKSELYSKVKMYQTEVIHDHILKTYLFYFYDIKGFKHEVYDETRNIASLQLMAPILGLRLLEGMDKELEINDLITHSVGIPLHTLHGSLDEECTEFQMCMFDAIQEAEEKRSYDGFNHYAFPEEVIYPLPVPFQKPRGCNEMFEPDLDELLFNESAVQRAQKTTERINLKLANSENMIHVFYRPTETDEYLYCASVGKKSVDVTPFQIIDEALDHLKRREGVEIKEGPEDFVLQVAGKQCFMTRPIALSNFAYIRTTLQNYRNPLLILRLKSMIFERYPRPPPIIVPAYIHQTRKIQEERRERDRLMRQERQKVTEREAKRGSRKRRDGPEGDDAPTQGNIINFWDLEDDLKLRISSASEIAGPGMDRLFVRVAVTVGPVILAQKDTPIVSPNNPRWSNCLLDFGLYLKDVPKSAQFSFSLICERQKKNISELVPVGWANLRLFDWQDFLIQGKKTILFWPFPKDLLASRECKDNRNLLNPTGFIGSYSLTVARLEVELTEYSGKVQYPGLERLRQFTRIVELRASKLPPDPEQTLIEDFDRGSENVARLINLRKVLDVRLLPIEDQQFLWRARKKISSNFPGFLPLIVELPQVWKSREYFCELYGMLEEWPAMEVDAAMELLDGRYSDTRIRECAVERIDKALSNDQLLLYLLPLVQTLRYEPFANSALSKMLVKRGLLNYTVGHTLFWLLRVELNYFDPKESRVPQFYSRFAICLEMYLRGNAAHLPAIVKQVELVEVLTHLNAMVKTVGAKESATRKLQHELNQKKDVLQNMLSPLNPSEVLGELIIEKCSVLGSAKQPLKLTWRNPEPLARMTTETHQIIFKLGDDLRQDMLTLQVMRIMDAKWKIHNLDYNMTLYEVLPMGKNVGMIHVVQQCQTLFQIQVAAEQFGSTLTMDMGLINNYMFTKCANNDTRVYMECVERFSNSLAGYCVATYVLGIKDRHQDNIMLSRDGRLFHIDFGHFLGHTKRKLGINRERTDFILTEHFIYIVNKGREHNPELYEFKTFRDHCLHGFLILFHHARFFVVLFRMMLCMGLPELSKNDDFEFLRQSLFYDYPGEQALDRFLETFEGVVKSDFSTSVNWFFHSVKHL